ncbi:MAG: hypothetical protein AAFX93_02955 [Verrucomicrobiota bacterium]
MPDIESLADQFAGDDKALYMGWLEALSEGAFLQEEANLGEEGFEMMARACTSPKQFAIIVESFDEHAKEHPDMPNAYQLLVDHVDESNHNLSEWVAALEYFYDWLAQQKQKAPGLLSMLEYLSCCAESQSSLPHQESLPDVLTDMLDRYGYEG